MEQNKASSIFTEEKSMSQISNVIKLPAESEYDQTFKRTDAIYNENDNPKRISFDCSSIDQKLQNLHNSDNSESFLGPFSADEF